MTNRWFLSLFVAASIAVAQAPPKAMVEVPDAELEAAHQASPDDVHITGRLLHYYGRDNRDTAWSARFALLSWNVDHHPDAAFFTVRESYGDMPKPMRDQIKQLWIVQVQQHADNPRILRNAAIAMETQTQPTSIRVGGNVQQSNLIRQVKPEYPQAARDAGVQGTVRMTASIGEEGDIQSLQLESGHPLLVQAAMNAVKQWRYKPTLLNGNPVSVITTVDIVFTLDGSQPAGQLNPANGVKVQ